MHFYGKTGPVRWIYISPHLDDAVLSAGGLIREQTRAGVPVEIWTMMCGLPPEGEVSLLAQAIHEMWGFASAQEAMQGRRAEDQAAASLVGATSVHFDFLDAIYRRGAGGAWAYPEEVCVPMQPVDDGLPTEIAQAISLRLLPDDVLVCQLAVGGHVDHRIVRLAAELLGRPLWYDVDIPYAFNHPEEVEPATAALKASVQPISDASVLVWQEAILAYPSQFSGLFTNPEAMREFIHAYWAQRNGIDLWRDEGE